MFIFTTLLILIYSLTADNISNYIRLSFTLILLQVFSFMAGSFLGFLFGFPTHSEEKFQSKYVRNSSLKEITSWLTKIIVGVTLIELKDIYFYLKSTILALSNYLNVNDNQVIVIGAVLGVYFILGFIVLYILSVTSIFEELVINDRNIEKILGDQSMNPNALNTKNVNDVLSSDISQISLQDKEVLLSYVSHNGVDKLEPLLTKRLGKFLFTMKEYDSAAKAYESAYQRNNEDKYSLLNACSIRSIYLKEFEVSNKKLLDFIKSNENFAPAYYNLACNFNRELKEFTNSGIENNYTDDLKSKANNYLKKAFELDRSLYNEALNDTELVGADIEMIFNSLNGN